MGCYDLKWTGGGGLRPGGGIMGGRLKTIGGGEGAKRVRRWRLDAVDGMEWRVNIMDGRWCTERRRFVDGRL